MGTELDVCGQEFSTSEVYGDPSVHPQAEDYWGHVNPIGPRSCYDEGKRSIEFTGLELARMVIDLTASH